MRHDSHFSIIDSDHFCCENVRIVFLAPTGDLEEGILSVCACISDIMLRMALKEFLKHSKESRDVLGQASRQSSKQASTLEAFSWSHAL